MAPSVELGTIQEHLPADNAEWNGSRCEGICWCQPRGGVEDKAKGSRARKDLNTIVS